MKLVALRWLGFWSLMTVIAVNGFYVLSNQQVYIEFLENSFFTDGNIRNPELTIARIFLLLLVLLTIWMHVTSKSVSLSQSFAQSSKINKSALLFLIFPAIVYNVLILTGGDTVLVFFAHEDGFFEVLTALFALATSVILLMSTDKIEGRVANSILIGLAFLFFIFGMEELSWGQRLIGWETPAGLKAVNYQDEYNFHNLFNPILRIFYPIFNLIVGAVLVNSKAIGKGISRLFASEKQSRIFPRPEFIFWGFLFLALSVHGMIRGHYSHELNEIMIACFGVAYSVDQLYMKRAARA